MPRQRKNLSDAALQLIADRFKVLSEPMRLKILHALWDGEQTVGQIIASTHGLQANVSKHLGMLQQSGLVSRRKEGLNVYYRIVDEVVFDLCETVCESLHDRLTEQIGELTPVPQRKRA
jgi:DNA-binding transcriptional ArsR family regulator